MFVQNILQAIGITPIQNAGLGPKTTAFFFQQGEKGEDMIRVTHPFKNIILDLIFLNKTSTAVMALNSHTTGGHFLGEPSNERKLHHLRKVATTTGLEFNKFLDGLSNVTDLPTKVDTDIAFQR